MTNARLIRPVVLTALVVAASAMMAGFGGVPRLRPGQAAPALALVDTTGTSHTLSSYRGRTVVLEWIDTSCPVVTRLHRSGLVQASKEAARAIDPTVVWLSVNSTSGTDVSTNDRWIRDMKASSPVLLDADGSAARSFGVRSTAHYFVIDAKGRVVYHGALDDDRTGKKAERGEVVVRYVVDAVRASAAQSPMKPFSVQPYGSPIRVASPPESKKGASA
ncbi:MAG: redoxin family protein, partial [Phycisphaerales bacterium]|nr:redoxin family protein [Phycisphaerales bacterium]